MKATFFTKTDRKSSFGAAKNETIRKKNDALRDAGLKCNIANYRYVNKIDYEFGEQ